MVWVRERTIPTERSPLVGEVIANFFADRGCHVFSVTDPYGRILDFLDRSSSFLSSSFTYHIKYFRLHLEVGRQRDRSSNPGGIKNSNFSILCRPAPGYTQPPIQWLSADFSSGVKRQEREADHSPPTSAMSRKMDLYIQTPPILFRCVVLS
jgi:hypothetical protein